MNGITLYLRHITAVFFVVLLAQSCYTTFQTARSSGTDDYDASYPYTNDDPYYLNEDNPDYAQNVLIFRPSRFVVVKENHYGFGNYHRKVKYTVYENDPWYDPWYEPYTYFSPYAISLNIYIGSPYHRHRPWIYFAYRYPYLCWNPIIVWYDPYDPWYWNPIWVTYPVNYPVIVYNPSPVYYDPYYPPDREYKKRDWDKRQSEDGRRFVGRAPSDKRNPSAPIKTQPTQIGRRSEPGSAINGSRGNDRSGRIVERRQTDTIRRDSRPEEKKQTRVIQRASDNSREVEKRNTTHTVQKPVAPANRIIAREMPPLQEKREPVRQHSSQVEERRASKNQNLPVSERVTRTVKNEAATVSNYQSRSQSSSATPPQRANKTESRITHQAENRHSQSAGVKTQRPEVKRTESPAEKKSMNRSSEVGRKSR